MNTPPPQSEPVVPIRRRTDAEMEAYIQGFEAAVRGFMRALKLDPDGEACADLLEASARVIRAATAMPGEGSA